jgi:hypothetical protein
MIPDELDDQLLCDLRRVPVHFQHEERAERVRRRCRAALGRRQLHLERSTRRARLIQCALERTLVGGLSLIYLLAVVLDVLRLFPKGK